MSATLESERMRRTAGIAALLLGAVPLGACDGRAAASSSKKTAAPAPGAAPARKAIEPAPSASTAPPAPAPAAARRLYAKTRFVWIRPLPDYAAEWIGYLWAGDSVALARETPVAGNGCKQWYAIEPRGYVCADDKRATLDVSDPELALVRRYARDPRSPNPHRYAESMGVQRYEKLPSPDEQRIREPALSKHLERVAASRVGPVNPLLDGVDLTDATEPAPVFPSLPIQIQIPKRAMRRDSTVAFFEQYLHEGRTFLLTADFAWVPKDRTKPYTPATFEGVHPRR